MIIYKNRYFTFLSGTKESPFCITPHEGSASEEAILQQQLTEATQQYVPVKQISMLNQIHSTKHTVISSFEEATDIGFRQTEGDALITNIAQNGIGMATADCLPIALYDTKHHACALIHAGWRGLIAGIIEETLLTMSRMYHTNPVDIEVIIGPSADVCCYEVNAEWTNQLTHSIDIQAVVGRNEKLFFNLPGSAYHRLLHAGIPSAMIHRSLHRCTICSPDFWSYRREKEQCLRNVTLMILHEK